MQSEHAKAAKLIRQHLKANGIKARVRTRTASMMTAIDVEVYDQMPAAVKAILNWCKQFEYGHFDGMTDSYEYSNRRNDIPQVKYLHIQNRWSETKRAEAWAFVRAYYADASDSDTLQTGADADLLYREMNRENSPWVRSQKPRVRPHEWAGCTAT
jgi:hypothetical protein